MRTDDYRMIADSELLSVLLSVCNGPDFNPGRKELRASLESALPEADAKVIDALMTKCEGYAQKALDPQARFDLRAGARELALHVIKTLQAADRLVPAEDGEVDVKGTLEAMDSWDPTQRRLTMADHAARQAADIESAKRFNS